MSPTERNGFGVVTSVGARGRRADRLNLGQLLTARHHHLGHFLEAYLQLTQCLLGVTVGPVLNAGCFLAAALDQRLALLLGLLAELQRVFVNSLGLIPAFLLQTQGFTANRLQILQRLLSVGFMLLSMMSLQLNRFLIQLLTTLQTFLLKLLAA